MVLNHQALRLIEKAWELLEYCNSQAFDQKLFQIKLKNFTDLYKRCDYATQGEYHELWKTRLEQETTK